MSDLVLVSFVPGIDTNILLQSQQNSTLEEDDTTEDDRPKRRRARIRGRFVADNPATPDVNEAYEEEPIEGSLEEEGREN